MIPRTLSRKAASAIAAVIFLSLVLFQFGLFPALTQKVVYVDKATGQVVADFIVQDPKPGVEDSSKSKESDAKQEEKASQDEPKEGNSEDGVFNSDERRAPGDCVVPGKRVKATFVTLARNKELWDLIKAIRNVEDRFNRKFHYDWVFLNDEPFTEKFKTLTSSIVSGTAKYGLVPKEHWSYPEWIDQNKAAETRQQLKEQKVIYGDLESYHHMCRYESGFFWRHSLLEDYDWYWRVEPGIQVNCDLDYDLFKFMEDNNKVYGFTITIHEFIKTIPTLWERTKEFIGAHPEYIAKDNLMKFISDDNGETYNLCHFWSNFEVASLKFWRSQAYREYFEYLDKAGGFFYERWGDAPIHSIAASLFLPKDQIHFFEDVGYNHGVYGQCPLNDEFRFKHRCTCNPNSDFTFRPYSCGKQYYAAAGLEKPKEWVDYQ